MTGRDSFGTEGVLEVGERRYRIHRLSAFGPIADLGRLPYSIKVLLENLLRHEDGVDVQADDIEAAGALRQRRRRRNARSPSRPPASCCRTSPACPRSSTWPPCATPSPRSGGDPSRINPLVPVELVIDHSVIADVYGRRDALRR